MLIGIDHGNKQIKTAHCAPFTSGLKESEVLLFGKDILQYEGKYYQLTDQRILYHRNKTSDQRFFILTLFAIAQELEAQGINATDTQRIQLAVGLPPAHYGAQHREFSQYFLRRGTSHFTYRERAYSILIDDMDTPPNRGELVRRQAKEFADDLLSTLRDRGLELRSGPVVFVGGGSILLRRQIEVSGKVRNPVFVDDIRANTKGYELLYRVSHFGR